MFAGKINALLFRKWKNRAKGRDFYDYLWYVATDTPVHLPYLHQQAFRNGNCKKNELQNLEQLKSMLFQRFDSVDFQDLKRDVLPFIKDARQLEYWSAELFKQATEKLRAES